MTEGTLDRNFRVALVSVDADGVPEWVFEKIRAAGIEIAIETCDNKEDLERVASYADVVWLFGGGLLFSEQNRQNFDAVGPLRPMAACSPIWSPAIDATSSRRASSSMPSFTAASTCACAAFTLS